MRYCSTCLYPAPCGRCEDTDNSSARIVIEDLPVKRKGYRLKVCFWCNAHFEASQEYRSMRSVDIEARRAGWTYVTPADAYAGMRMQCPQHHIVEELPLQEPDLEDLPF